MKKVQTISNYMQISLRFHSQLEISNWKEERRMIESKLDFNKLGLIGRFQLVSFLHVVHSREFSNLLLVEMTYIMKTHQELEKILDVSSTVHINMYLANTYCLINILEINFLLSFFVCVFKFHLFSCWQTNVQIGDTSRDIS